MNAPWAAGQASSALTKDAFTGFVADQDSVNVLKTVVSEMGWPVDKIFMGGLRNAVQTLSVSASPKVLLVDISGSGNPLEDIHGLAEVCEPGTIVVALGEVNDVQLYRELLGSGIHDYLLKPLSADLLRESFMLAQAAMTSPKKAVEEEVVQRKVISVVGVRGGVGASSIAAALGWLSSDHAELKTALLDLDIHFGIGALTFDLEPGRGLTDALENPSRIDSLFIERAIVKASDKLSILSAEAPVNTPLLADGAALHHLQEELRQAYPVTIVDLPRILSVQTPSLLADSNDIVLVTDLSLVAARDTIRMLGFLKVAASSSRVWVVANKVGSGADVEVSQKDFEASIERPIDLVIPLDAKAMTMASKEGRPIVAAQKSCKVSQGLMELHRLLASEDAAPGKGRGSILDKLNGMLTAALKKDTKDGASKKK